MTLCREHHFGSDDKCEYCQIQNEYYVKVMTALKNWTQKRIDSSKRPYEILIDRMMCKVHSHDENPLEQLYDMEGEVK